MNNRVGHAPRAVALSSVLSESFLGDYSLGQQSFDQRPAYEA